LERFSSFCNESKDQKPTEQPYLFDKDPEEPDEWYTLMAPGHVGRVVSPEGKAAVIKKLCTSLRCGAHSAKLHRTAEAAEM